MAFELKIKDQTLTQEQLDAIVPVMNAGIFGQIKKKDFEQACIDAMAEAGCPFVEKKA